jgi:hypothetical protein
VPLITIQSQFRYQNLLLKRSDSSIQDSARVNLLLLLRDNYFKTYQYKKAAETGQDILTNYKAILGDRLHDIENSLIIHEGLKDIPPQQIGLKKYRLNGNAIGWG